MTEDLLKRMENIEEFVGMPKGAIEPPVGTVVGSVSGPLTARPDKEDLDLDELLRKLQAYIDDAIAQALGNYISDLPADVYELLEEYITNNITFGGGGTDIYLAQCTAAAGEGATIAATVGGGVGAQTIYCKICGGSALNAAIPRLAINDYISVAKIGEYWYCLTVFQTSEDCVCS